MISVKLYGRLAKFGGPFSLAVGSTAEAIRALSVNLPGFKKEIGIGAYRITAGDRRKGRKVTEDRLTFGLPTTCDLHIVPATAGSKSGGVGKLIMGVALIAVATVASGGAFGAAVAGGIGGVGWGGVALFGASFAFAGIAQMLTPTPKAPSASSLERPEERPSFLMSSPVNVASQGNPIPIIGGRVRAGSVVVSMGVSTERIAVPA